MKPTKQADELFARGAAWEGGVLSIIRDPETEEYRSPFRVPVRRGPLKVGFRAAGAPRHNTHRTFDLTDIPTRALLWEQLRNSRPWRIFEIRKRWERDTFHTLAHLASLGGELEEIIWHECEIEALTRAFALAPF